MEHLKIKNIIHIDHEKGHNIMLYLHLLKSLEKNH